MVTSSYVNSPHPHQVFFWQVPQTAGLHMMIDGFCLCLLLLRLQMINAVVVAVVGKKRDGFDIIVIGDQSSQPQTLPP